MNTLSFHNSRTGRIEKALRAGWARWLSLDADLPQFGADFD